MSLPRQPKPPKPMLKLFIDFLPVAIFFGAYFGWGLYVATAAIMATMLAQVLIALARGHRPSPLLWLSTLLVLMLGGMTLWLHDPAYLKWKPTIVNWLFAAILGGALWARGTVLLRLLLDQAIVLPDRIWKHLTIAWVGFFVLTGLLNLYVAFGYRITEPDLNDEQRVTLGQILSDQRTFEALVPNHLRPAPELHVTGQRIGESSRATRTAAYLAKLELDTWVKFKLFGLLGLTLLFTVLQAIYLAPYVTPSVPTDPKGTEPDKA